MTTKEELKKEIEIEEYCPYCNKKLDKNLMCFHIKEGFPKLFERSGERLIKLKAQLLGFQEGELSKEKSFNEKVEKFKNRFKTGWDYSALSIQEYIKEIFGGEKK
jgi:hypothetical protein